MTKEQTVIKMATRYNQKLKQILKDGLAGQKANDKFNLQFNDLIDLMNYSRFIMSKQYVKAHQLQEDVDTGVRESIPCTLFDFVSNRAERA